MTKLTNVTSVTIAKLLYSKLKEKMNILLFDILTLGSAIRAQITAIVYYLFVNHKFELVIYWRKFCLLKKAVLLE